MSTSRVKPAEQDYFDGFSEASTSADHDAPSAEVFFVENEVAATSTGGSWSKSDQDLAGTVIEHIVDLNTVAATTRVSRLQGEPVVRLPHAARLPAAAGLPTPTDLMSFAPETGEPETWTWVRAPRQSHFSLSGVKIFLIIMAIASPLAVIFFVFANSSFKENITALWRPIHDKQTVAPTPLANAVPSTIEPQNSAASIKAQALPGQSGPQGVRETQPQIRTQASTRSDRMADMSEDKVTASRPASGIEGTDYRVAAAPNVNLGGEAAHVEAARLSEVQAGVWTRCTVYLIPSGQIAVQKATTYQTCISAGKKCAGTRHYAEIQFFDRPTLTTKVPLELCDTGF